MAIAMAMMCQFLGEIQKSMIRNHQVGHLQPIRLAGWHLVRFCTEFNLDFEAPPDHIDPFNAFHSKGC